MNDDDDRKPVDYKKADAHSNCGALHIQPEHWKHHDGAAYCPRCKKWLGRIDDRAKPTKRVAK